MFNNDIIKKQNKNARPLKIAKEIKVILADIIIKGQVQSVELFDINITINQVEVSSDLTSARVSISCFDNTKDMANIIKLLNKNKGFFRHKIGQKLHIKTVPILTFYADSQLDKLENIQKLLDTIK